MLQSGLPSGYHIPGALESSWELVKRFLWYLFVLDFWRSRAKKNLTSSLNRHASIEILVSGNVAKVEKLRDSFLLCPFFPPSFFQRILWDFISTSSFCENVNSMFLFFLTSWCSGNFFSQYSGITSFEKSNYVVIYAIFLIVLFLFVVIYNIVDTTTETYSRIMNSKILIFVIVYNNNYIQVWKNRTTYEDQFYFREWNCKIFFIYYSFTIFILE